MRWRRILGRSALVGVGALLVMQLVPYGWRHPNPAVTGEPAWPSTEAEQLFDAACADCHSNETDWPIYSYVAPMSWLVRYDVERGREDFNISTWDDDDGEAGDAAETIEEGSMPPRQYTLLHPDARLSDAEKQVLIDALEQIDRAR